MDKAFSEFFEEHLGVNKTHVPDYNKMLEKTHKYDCSGFFIGYALKLLRSKIRITSYNVCYTKLLRSKTISTLLLLKLLVDFSK